MFGADVSEKPLGPPPERDSRITIVDVRKAGQMFPRGGVARAGARSFIRMKRAHDLSGQTHQHQSEDGAVAIVRYLLNSIDLAAQKRDELARVSEGHFIGNRLHHGRGL